MPTNSNQSQLDQLIAQRAAVQAQINQLQSQQGQLGSSSTAVHQQINSLFQIQEQLTVEISRLQNTPAATNTTEQQAIASQRAGAIADAQQALSSTIQPNTSSQRPNAPHYFVERPQQYLYHDLIVYIQGADVTKYLMGNVTVTLGCNDAINTASITLNNTGDLFTITTENIAGIWRLNNDQPFNEVAKKRIFDIKNNPAWNPYDVGTRNRPGSGARRWNLAYRGSIFHRNDPIRIWTHNPMTDDVNDEWVPVFTGYILTKTYNFNSLTGESTVTISAHDIRELMQHMRVSTNNALYVNPDSTRTSGGAVPTGINTPNSQNISSNRAPQAQGVLRSAGAIALTQANLSSSLINSVGNAAAQSVIQQANRANESLQRNTGNLISSLARDLAFFADYTRDGGTHAEAWANNSYGQISHAMTVGGTQSPLPLAVNRAGEDQQPHTAVGDPRHAVGRMRVGLVYLYPDPDNDSNTSPRTSARTRATGRAQTSNNGGPTNDNERNIRILDRWYKLCFFGSPIRNDVTGNNNTDLAPTIAETDFRYWTRNEVDYIGINTVTDGICAPDMQLVHWLLPRQGTEARSDSLTEVTIVSNGNVNVERNWTSRLDFLKQMTDMVDYRFWVTGCGDIVFEFPMYDFHPEDWGSWSPVLTADDHVMDYTTDEEHGDVPTMVIASGSFTTIPGNVHEPRGFVSPPHSTAYSPILAARYGIKVQPINYPWLNDVSKLQLLATVNLQKAMMAADSFGVTLAHRIFITPNRPLHVIPAERISLINSVTHTWVIHGEAGTTVDLFGSRYLDTQGVRRNLTGGRALPLSFAAVPGRLDYNTVGLQTFITAAIGRLRASGFTDSEIVFGRAGRSSGNTTQWITQTPDGTTTHTPAPTSQQIRDLQSVQQLLSHNEAYLAQQSANRSAGVSQNATQTINAVIDGQTLPPGNVSLNVVPGFQSQAAIAAAQGGIVSAQSLQQSLQSANSTATQLRNQQTNDTNTNNQTFHRQPTINFGISGIRTLDEIQAGEQQVRMRTPGNQQQRRTAFSANRVPITANVFGCSPSVSPTVDFYRQLRRAIARAVPTLTQHQVDMLACLSALETGTGTSMRNNNVGNIIVRSTNYSGQWFFFDCCQYASYPDLEGGARDLYQFLQANFTHTAFPLFQQGNAGAWIQSLYGHGYSATTNGLSGPDYGIAQQGDYNVLLRILRTNAQRIANAPECDPTANAQQSANRNRTINQYQERRYQQLRATQAAQRAAQRSGSGSSGGSSV